MVSPLGDGETLIPWPFDWMMLEHEESGLSLFHKTLELVFAVQLYQEARDYTKTVGKLLFNCIAAPSLTGLSLTSTYQGPQW